MQTKIHIEFPIINFDFLKFLLIKKEIKFAIKIAKIGVNSRILEFEKIPKKHKITKISIKIEKIIAVLKF